MESVTGRSANWPPARVPDRNALDGEAVTLEMLDPARHAESLFTSSHGAGTERLWEFMSYGPFAGRDEFTEWLMQGAGSSDPLFYAVVDRKSMRALGMASYLRIVPEHAVIEIGHIWFAPEIQRTRQATEAIFLLASHAFDDLGYRRLEWKCNSLNAASRRAAERFGFTFEGVFRQHMVIKGSNRDTAWYAMTDVEWPLRRAAFEAWLAPDNFDEAGLQGRSLTGLRDAIEADKP